MDESPFTRLADDCLKYIISLMSFKSAAQVAAVSPRFKSAADSDTVWERFLPPNYEEIVRRLSVPPPEENFTKKQLFFFLRTPCLSLDDGRLIFSLNSSGEKGYRLTADALEVSSVNDPNNWNGRPHEDWRYVTRFPTLGACQDRIKMSIRGIIQARMLSPQTKYRAWLMFDTKATVNHPSLYPLQKSIKLVKNVETTEEGEEGDNEELEIGNVCFGSGYKGICFRPKGGSYIGDFFIGEVVEYDLHIQISEADPPMRRGLIIKGIELQPWNESGEEPPRKENDDWYESGFA